MAEKSRVIALPATGKWVIANFLPDVLILVLVVGEYDQRTM
jgi:hypothetical protein